MKIKFDAQELMSQIHLVKAALPGSKLPIEESLGIRAADKQLTVYAFAKNQWARIVIPGEVEEEGMVIVNRQRFFNLIGLLKGQVKLQLSGTQVKITTDVQAGKFSMTTSVSFVPKPNPRGAVFITVSAALLLRQLQLCTLNEELMGGGFKVSFGETLDILSTDRVRLIDTHQKLGRADWFQMVVPSESIKGVTEILKIAKTGGVKIKASSNVTSWEVENETGSFEYGSVNISVPFPDPKKITGVKDYPNHAMLEVADVLEAVKRVTVLADSELAWGDFDFNNEACTISTEAVEGLSEVIVDANAMEIKEEATAVLRLQLGHVQTFMSKAQSQGVKYMDIEWGDKLPVKFTPCTGPEEEIDIKFICAALKRASAKEAKA